MSALFANPWGLLALTGAGAVLALHLFWQRFRPRRIAGLFLWAAETRQIIAGRTRDRLHRTLSLLFELLAAVMLALAVAEISPVGAPSGEHLVLVLDGSASMRARATSGATFARRATDKALRELATLGLVDKATVILSGPSPAVLAGPRASAEAARAAVAAYDDEEAGAGTPRWERDELDRAISLAIEIASGEGRVIAYSDTARSRECVPAGVEYVAVGEPRPNVAIVAADRSFAMDASTKERVFVAVRNLGTDPAACRVAFRRHGAEDTVVDLDLASAQTRPVAITIPRGGEVVRVSLEAPPARNALDVDDDVSLLPERFPTVVYDNRLTDRAQELLQRAVDCARGVASSSGVARGAPVTLVFCAGDEPAPSGAWRVIVAPPASKTVKRLAGPYVMAKSRYELEDVSFRGVLWTADAEPATPPEGARPLVSCGDRVLAWWEGEDPRTYTIDIDLARSGLASSPAWPVFVTNIIEQRRRALPGVGKRNHALGDVVRMRLNTVTTRYDVDRDGAKTPLPGAGQMRAFPARPVGPGSVVTETGEVYDRFRVNFLAPRESDLRGLGEGHVESLVAASTAAATRDRFRWPAALAAAIALAAFIADWYVLGRATAAVTKARA